MPSDNLQDLSIPLGKIYKDRAITAATYFGGPLVASYLIAENFKTFKEFDKVKTTWNIGIVSTILIFSGVLMIPESVHIPNFLIPLIYTAIAGAIITKFQRSKIQEHTNGGGLTFSGWRVFAVASIGAVLTVLPFIMILLTYNGASQLNLETRTYGTVQNEINYEKGLTVSEVDKMGEALMTTGFFDNVDKKYAYEKKVGSTYELSIVIDPSIANLTETIKAFKEFRADLQTHFTANKISIVLIGETMDDVRARIDP